jgi:hypothetical protein
MLGQQAVGVALIARDTRLTRQTIYRIKDDPAGRARLSSSSKSLICCRHEAQLPAQFARRAAT